MKPGTRLGPYEILGPLGAGGMGEVYRARDAKLGRDVAVKVLPADVSSDPKALARFESEAKAVAALSHPNILAIHDFGRQGETAYAVMELLEGETLRARLAYGALPARKAVDLAVQIARGLAAAHDKGIVHRDLKPENVFVTAEGHVKVLDFGLAKKTSHGSGSESGLSTVGKQTEPGTVLGTVRYMSPEQVRGEAVDHRSDIFSFGAMLYEMLAGRQAFGRKTFAESMAAILTEDPPQIAASGSGPSPALQRIVQHCLEKKPGERFQSARDMAFDLEALSGSAVRIGPSGTDERKGLRPWLIAIGAVAALGVAALAFWLMSSGVRVAPPAAVRASILVPEGLTIATGGQFPRGYAALSPDGRFLVFPASSKDRGVQLWIRPLDATEARPLPGTEQASYPFWAPDNKSIGFFARGKLKTVSVAGGVPSIVCDAPSGRGGAWGRDGTILYAPAYMGSGLYRVPAAGGPPQPVTRLDATKNQATHRWPSFLPDGRHFLYYAGALDPLTMDSSGPWNGIFLGSLDSGPGRFLARSDSEAQFSSSHILFMRQNTLLAVPFDPRSPAISGDPSVVVEDVERDFSRLKGGFTVSEGRTLAYHPGAHTNWTQLSWLDRSGRRLGSVGEPGIMGEPTLSPDGRRAAVSVFDAGSRIFQIWLYDLASGTGVRFTLGSSASRSPIWSSDGSLIYFSSNQTGPGNLFVKQVSGVGQGEQVVHSEGWTYPTDCSKDGRFLVFTLDDPTGDKREETLWVLPLSGEKKATALARVKMKNPAARISPESRWIAYESDETGRSEVYVAAFPGSGGRSQVSTGGALSPRWRRDGKELYFISSEDELMAVDARVGASIEFGSPRPLFKLPPIPNTMYWFYDVSADGEKFLVLYPVVTKQEPLSLLLNWRAALGK